MTSISAGTRTHTSPTLPSTRVGPRDVTEWRSKTGKRLADRQQKIADRVGARRTLIASLVAGGAIAAAAAFGAARVYDAVTDRDGIASFDKPMLARAKTLRSRPINTSAASIAHVFGPIGLPALTLAAGGLLAARERHVSPLILLLAAGAGSLAMTLTGKGIIDRNRPHERDAIPPFEKSPSFPSGHTLNATTILGTLAYLLALHQEKNSTQAVTITAAAGVAATVGLSRVLLGAHWFTDVAVGWIASAGWLSLIVTAHRLYLTTVTPTHRDELTGPA